jgi:DNA topoisomerase-1
LEEVEINRWQKKKSNIENLSNNIQRLRLNITKDLNNGLEKDMVTALVISIMDKTGERVGNNESAENGHFGITGLKKKHLKVNGNTVSLKYIGKSGVEQEKKFTDEKIANALKKVLKNQGENIFVTSDGFKISNDRVNRYLGNFDVTAKDIRGYSANKWVLKKLQEKELPKEEKDRKKTFSEILKSVSEKIGHGKATLRKHYLIPELEISYIEKGKLIDLSDKSSYEAGGTITKKEFIYDIGGF